MQLQSPDPTHDFFPFPFFFFFFNYFRLPSIYFAIYRHTYRTYLYKLCNTDEPTHPRVGHLARLPLFILTHPSHACLRAQIAFYMNVVLDISCASLYLRALSHTISHILSLSFSLYHAYIISLDCIVSRQLFVTYVMCALCLHVYLSFVKTLFTFISFYTLLSAIFLVDYGVFFPVFFLQLVVAHLNTISLQWTTVMNATLLCNVS